MSGFHLKKLEWDSGFDGAPGFSKGMNIELKMQVLKLKVVKGELDLATCNFQLLW